ncbi:MAG TPA: response regulator [Ignavibacteria bacterium]|nr:response regulator [Ignavibacteria bacterium]HMQ99139.1 response regulator [Ignavibacteria bacterium]
MNILILIVEDDKYMNETLCEVLESEGYNVESALSALDAINKIKHSEKYYQLLILDYNLQYLQGITGLDIFEMAKEKDPGVKAIMISAYGKDKELKEKARSTGIDAFIDKPFLITDLIDTVDGILRHSASKEAASQ